MEMLSKEVTLIVILSLFLFLVGIGIILLVLVYQKKRVLHLTEKKDLQAKFSQTLLQSQLEIQEQTLQHIGHELHDNLGQVASLIKINLTTLPLDDAARAKEKIENTRTLARQLISDLKALSVSLGADRISQSGLVKAIETEVDRLNQTGQFSARLVQEETLPAMNGDKATILFRMVQEALNNSVKHGSAREIVVLLKATENLFTLAIKDDGVGFDKDQTINKEGAGLRNLQNRARLINAQLAIDSTPGNGTTVTIELPLQ